jgi:hypothetical protein
VLEGGKEMRDRGAEIGSFEIIDGDYYFVENKGGTLSRIGRVGLVDRFIFALKKDIKRSDVIAANKKWHLKKYGWYNERCNNKN